jgi:hypothetical protein
LAKFAFLFFLEVEMIYVEIFPLQSVAPAQCCALEMDLEQVLDGTWDETDEVEGRMRYRQYCSTRSEAKSIVTRLKGLKSMAEIQIKEETPLRSPPLTGDILPTEYRAEAGMLGQLEILANPISMKQGKASHRQ